MGSLTVTTPLPPTASSLYTNPSRTTPSTTTSTSTSLTATPAFKALWGRYLHQRTLYTKSSFASQIDAQLLRTQNPNPFSTTSLPKLRSLVVIGLGTLTRIPNALWDPESSTYQFLLLEHIIARLHSSGGSYGYIEDVFIQDPAFTTLDAAIIENRIPQATVLNSPLIVEGAEPAASLITGSTMLYMPFVDVEIVAQCLAPQRAPVVICANVEQLLHRVGKQYARTRRKASLRCIQSFEAFLDAYQGEELPAFLEKDEAFERLWIYWKKPGSRRRKSTSRARAKEDSQATAGCVVM